MEKFQMITPLKLTLRNSLRTQKKGAKTLGLCTLSNMVDVKILLS